METEQGFTDTQACTEEFTGERTRLCLEEGVWDEINTDGCIKGVFPGDKINVLTEHKKGNLYEIERS